MPDNATTAAISAAEKSILDSKLVTIISKGAPVVKELIPLLSVLLFGVKDSQEMQKLRQIYGELGKINAKIEGLPAQVNYDKLIGEVRGKVRDIHETLDGKQVKNLRDTEFQALCNFVTPGVSMAANANYKSCIANLLDKAYGVELNSVLGSSGHYAMGHGNCAAVAVNNSILSAPVLLLEYLRIHMNFAAELAALVLAVCLAAHDTYQFLKNNRDEIKKRFAADMKTTVDNMEITLAEEKIKADIGDMKASTFLSTRLMPSLATAPAHLCGVAYRLVGAMMQNADPGQTVNANTKIKISHAKGAVSSENNSKLYVDKIWAYPTEYTKAEALWTASFSHNNNTEANYINLAGRHGGFLGMVGERKLEYVYEIMSDKRRHDPVYEWNRCIWEVRVRHDKNQQLVFLFINKEYSSKAMANNHGFAMPTDPGFYTYEPDNPDQYWKVEL